MHSSPFVDGFAARRVVALVLVGLLVLSGVAGLLGSGGIAAAQQGPSDGDATTTPTNATNGNQSNNSSSFINGSTGQQTGVSADFYEWVANVANMTPSGASAALEENPQNAERLISIYEALPTIGNASALVRENPRAAARYAQGMIYIAEEGISFGLPDINLPNLMQGKLRSIADNFKQGASAILTDVYDLAFSTPVPENSGWQSIFGTPTNDPFQPLYQQLLVDRLYPVTNYLLGIGVMVLGVSVVMNPLVSRFQAIDLGIKFVTFLLLYAFTWPAITLMHGITNDITMWIRPSASEMAALVDTIGMIEAGSIGAVGAYFAGSGGILATVFSLGIELGLRRIALEFFFPYVFPALVLLVYLSPWQRLRAYASMGIWQYVNLLTMVIPMAIVLRAAAIAGVTLDGSGVVAMLTVIALFLVTASIPVVSTYFFIQMSGSAYGYVTSAAGGAASRVGSAKDKIGGGGESSSDSTDSSDSTATATTSPGDRAQAMVGSVRASETSHSESQPRSVGEFGSSSEREHDATDSATTTEHDAADSTTTAGKIRALHEKEKRDSMDPKAMKTAYFGQQSHRST